MFRSTQYLFVHLIILLFTKFTFQNNVTQQCGVRQVNESKPECWPWHAIVYHRENRSYMYACGGTLISEKFVLTTKHCVTTSSNYKMNVTNIRIQLGVHDMNDLNQLQQYQVQEIHLPQGPPKLRHDIALLRLKNKAALTPFVQPACIETKNITSENGTAIGFGLTETGELSDVLQQCTMPVVDGYKCAQSDKGFGQTLDVTLGCAGHTSGCKVCNGDSGGGLYFHRNGVWYVGGIVSFLPSDENNSTLCSSTAFVAFTRVEKYLKWIENITEHAGGVHRGNEEIDPCKPGYGGPDCNTVKDICLAQRPCENGGLCHTKHDGSLYTCECHSGFLGRNCEHAYVTNIESKFSGDGFLEMNARAIVAGADQNETKLAILFSTLERNGMLLWYGQRNGDNFAGDDYISLSVHEGYLEFGMRLDGEESTLRNEAVYVADGEQHVAVLTREANRNRLDVDQFSAHGETRPTGKQDIHLPGNVYIGGAPNLSRFTGERFNESFNGCVYVMENPDTGRPVLLENFAVRTVNVDACNESSPTKHICTKHTEYYDCQFQNVHLKKNQSDIFGLERNPHQNLTFKDSKLEYLPKSLIDAFPHVTLLNLNDLMITSIEPKAFERATNLHTMYFENNRLINVDGATFRGAKKLLILVLSKNEITLFNNYAFDSNTELQRLYLDQNQLYTLPNFTNNAQLQFLNASHNNLTSINDNHFHNQRNLKTLDVSFNQLERLDLQQLSANLDLLDVSFNALTDFIMPRYVIHLNAKNNSLKKFEGSQQCTLKALDLSRNKLEIQPDLGTCYFLELLDLSYNLLEAFEFQRSMARLQFLRLRHNNLFEFNLPINLRNIILPFSLNALDLSYNKLSYGPALSKSWKLQTVFLNDNYLISMKSYANSAHTNFKGYRMANNEWSCAEIPQFQNWTHDKDDDYCKPEMSKLSGICCRVYSKPYNDRLNMILREADFHERFNKKKCSIPVSIISDQNNLDEIRNAIANANTEKADKLKEIDKVRIDAFNKGKELESLQTKLDRLLSSKRNVASEIERQRLSHRVTREELITDKDMLERIFKFVQEKEATNIEQLSRRQNETDYANRLFDEKQQNITELKSIIEKSKGTNTALKNEEKDKKKKKNHLQSVVNNNSATIPGG